MIDEQLLAEGLALTLRRTDYADCGELQRGKVRDCYLRGDRRAIVVTDRLSAFDRQITTVPFKGQVLNGLSAYWLERVSDICPTHLIAVPDAQVSIVAECDPLPLELVMRAYLTGSSATSIWTHYARGERSYCGHRLPDGLREHERLPAPLLTPTTKGGAGAHDEPISAAEAVARGLVGGEELERIAELSAQLFSRGQQLASERGLILVDTKYELGRLPDGRLAVIDEVHTPDSSRYWYADSYERALSEGRAPRALDKEYVRRYLAERGFRGDGAVPAVPDSVRIEAARRYIEIFERITGRPFEPDLRSPVERIHEALVQSL